MAFRRAIQIHCAAALFLGLGLQTVWAKPPKNMEPPKQQLPPNVKAALTTQPEGYGAIPKTPAAVTNTGTPAAPQGTVSLKPGELPKIEFDMPTWDFGRVKTGKDVEHDFWFHNVGNGPLEIIQVKPS